MGPRLAGEWGAGDLDHRALLEGQRAPADVFRIPNVLERADGEAEEARRLVLRPLEKDEALLAVVADDLHGIAVAGLEILFGIEAEPDGDGGGPRLAVVAERAAVFEERAGVALFRKMERAAKAAGAGGEFEFVVERGGHEGRLGADVGGFFAAREIGVEAGVERRVKRERAREGGVGRRRRGEGGRGEEKGEEERGFHGENEKRNQRGERRATSAAVRARWKNAISSRRPSQLESPSLRPPKKK